MIIHSHHTYHNNDADNSNNVDTHTWERDLRKRLFFRGKILHTRNQHLGKEIIVDFQRRFPMDFQWHVATWFMHYHNYHGIWTKTYLGSGSGHTDLAMSSSSHIKLITFKNGPAAKGYQQVA